MPSFHWSHTLHAIAAKRFTRREKYILLLVAVLLLAGVHLGLQRWTAAVERRQIVAQPTIPAAAAGPTVSAVPADKAPPAPAPAAAEAPRRKIRDPFLASRNPQQTAKTTAAERNGVRLTVSGILWDETTPTAIINSKVVGIGDIIYGKAVVDIEKDRVIVMEDGTIQILYFKK